tara:strand:+ start:76 stop:273 length:198 start_codon:yes stop_codon:yes gene_type:complete
LHGWPLDKLYKVWDNIIILIEESEMQYLGEIKNGEVRILHVPTGITFDSWENAKKFDVLVRSFNK